MEDITTYYYVEKDNEIKLFDTDKTRLENTLDFMPELQGLEVKSTTDVTLLKPLEEFKKEKLNELSQKSSAFEQTENKEMYIISSLGYKVNADPKALRNIEVLINIGITQFRNYDNETVEVTTDNLKTIKSEIGINTVRLYQQKWAFEDLINKAKTKEELDAIEIKFEMLDFSQVRIN